jgi:hypothetical protein
MCRGTAAHTDLRYDITVSLLLWQRVDWYEKDIYEFIQRRSDWKKIEKTVDKTMYNLSFKEDCIIC